MYRQNEPVSHERDIVEEEPTWDIGNPAAMEQHQLDSNVPVVFYFI